MDSRRLLQVKGDEILRLQEQVIERDKIIEVICIFLGMSIAEFYF